LFKKWETLLWSDILFYSTLLSTPVPQLCIYAKFLKEKKHSCIELQKDVNGYGLDAFVFEVREVESQLAKRLKLEKKWIAQTPSEFLYNPTSSLHHFSTKPRIAPFERKDFGFALSKHS
jgi:hypothetical protein